MLLILNSICNLYLFWREKFNPMLVDYIYLLNKNPMDALKTSVSDSP